MNRLVCFLCLCVIAFIPAAAMAQSSATIAPTPPMGWNSWDAYGFTITESQFMANVDWLHQHLEPFGWQYVVIDEGWFATKPESSTAPGYTISPDGRYLPAVNRFPSADHQQGFKPLADSVHALGLKFGIHIIHGIPREAVEKDLPIAGSDFHAAEAANRSDVCRWNSDNYGLKDNAAGQAYYDSVIRLYADWGVDFLKVDCISAPYNAPEIHMLSEAIRKSGRPILLSLSPGPTPIAEANDVMQHAQMWRIADDFWDLWTAPQDKNGFPHTLKDQFTFLARWEPYAGPGHWPDADMLPIGYLGPNPGWGKPRQSRFTQEETRTLITIMAIARSPLILGANLTRMDAATEALLTNPEVIAVDQKTTENHPVENAGDSAIVLWTAREGSDSILAVFNRGDAPAIIKSRPWKELGGQSGLDQTAYHVRDLWQRKDMGKEKSLSITLPPHGAALFRLSR
jgi:hypothetical protein